MEVPEHSPSGERVVGVPAHGGHVPASRRRPNGPRTARDPLSDAAGAPAESAARAPYGRRVAVYSRRYIAPIYRTVTPGVHVLDLAILGLLKEQPLHGYELKKRLSETLGSLWGISYGSLYPALRRLERTGPSRASTPASPASRSPPPVRSTATSRRPAGARARSEPAHPQGVPHHRARRGPLRGAAPRRRRRRRRTHLRPEARALPPPRARGAARAPPAPPRRPRRGPRARRAVRERAATATPAPSSSTARSPPNAISNGSRHSSPPKGNDDGADRATNSHRKGATAS